MQKDLKIGLILGLAIVSAAGLWLATRPSLAPQARLLDPAGAEAKVSDERRVTRDESVRRSPPVRRRSSETRGPVHRAVIDNRVKSDRRATPAVNVQPETIKPQRFHIVRKGETLSEISYDYYGSAGKWRKIFEANRSTVKNANVVRAGTKLIIPD
jgi:LysM repeat protein